MASTCKTPNQNLEQFLSIIDLWALSIYFNEMGCMLTSSVKDYRGETGLKIYGGQFHSCPPPPPFLIKSRGGEAWPPSSYTYEYGMVHEMSYSVYDIVWFCGMAWYSMMCDGSYVHIGIKVCSALAYETTYTCQSIF